MTCQSNVITWQDDKPAGRIECEHIHDLPLSTHFWWDIDVRTSGPRFTIELCQECYNRLLGAVAGDLINSVIAKNIKLELRRGMQI